MTGIAVVDASALAAVTFREPAGPAIRDRLASMQLAAPHLLAYELTNTALMKLRRHPDQAVVIRTGLAGVLGDDFAIYWSDVDYRAVVDLALQTGLRYKPHKKFVGRLDLGLGLSGFFLGVGADYGI